MSEVMPEDVCYEILLRVPLVPLLRFRSVSKAWRRTIDDNTFIQSHHHHGAEHLIIRYDDNTAYQLYSLPLSDLECSANHTKSMKLISSGPCFPAHLGGPGIPSLPVPSCNGLILHTYRINVMSWKLLNPFTGESFKLPHREHWQRPNVKCGGIGYDSTTGDFKVVIIVQRNSGGKRMLETLIYSLKSNCWKGVTNFLSCTKPCRPGVFVNGALHWITHMIQEGVSTRTIIAFNISTGEDRVFPRPSFIMQGVSLLGFRLDVLGGYLCLRNHLGVWIMKDYGKNPWTQLVSRNQLRDMGNPIAYIKNKGKILFQHGNEFVLFDVEKKCGKKFHIDGLPKVFTSQVVSSSLFRLNTRGGGDGSASNKTLKRKRTTANNRLKLELKTSDVV